MKKRKTNTKKIEKAAPEERGHHRRSPSSLQYREACPAYEPDSDSDNDASRAGTRQHLAFEKRDLSICETEIEEWAVQRAIDYSDAIREEIGDNMVAEISEEYLTIDAQETSAGYPDEIFVYKDGDDLHAHVIDLKFGQWPVEPAENNLQGIAYGLGVLYRYPALQSFTVHFVMPYLDYIDVHTFTRDTFRRGYTRIKTVVAKTDVPDPEENPNEGCCMFCAKLGTCKAASKFFTSVGHKFAPLDIPKNVDTTLLMDNPKEAGLVMKIASICAKWAQALKSRMATEALSDEGYIPDGYKLISYPEREIVDLDKIAELARRMGVKKKDIEAIKKFGLTDIEKLVRDQFPRGDKKDGEEMFKRALEESGAVKKGRQVTYLGMDKQAALDN